MPPMTTIKVPRELRDRLASRARAQHTTLAGALAKALDDADEQAFWHRVREENARIGEAELRERVSDPTVRDDLADAADDAIPPGQW